MELYVSLLTIALLCASNVFLSYCKPQTNKSRQKKSNGKTSKHHHHRSDNKLSHFTAPQLSGKDKLYLAKIEDALTSKRGRLVFTNSWAVQLNPAQVASADQIAKRNGFKNMGQVSC